MLVVDWDAATEARNPANTVLVQPMSAFAAEAAAAEAAGRPAPADGAMQAIVQLVQRLRADAQASGEVDVPGSLAALRAEAVAAGCAPDAAGLAAYLRSQAARAVELDAERRASGLGGLLRRVADGLTALRGKPALAELHAARPYRDPAFELGEEALLAAKVTAVNARMDAAMRGGR